MLDRSILNAYPARWRGQSYRVSGTPRANSRSETWTMTDDQTGRIARHLGPRAVEAGRAALAVRGLHTSTQNFVSSGQAVTAVPSLIQSLNRRIGEILQSLLAACRLYDMNPYDTSSVRCSVSASIGGHSCISSRHGTGWGCLRTIRYARTCMTLTVDRRTRSVLAYLVRKGI